MSSLNQTLLPLEAQYQTRVWGGQKLKRNDPPVGEAWVAFEGSRVLSGAHAGQTVAELAAELAAELLGPLPLARYGTRFPLLIKLLDCADWLSVQVHPDDAQARRMVGAGEFGKTEAWHFLEVDPGARILAGVKPGTPAQALEAAIRGGTVLDVAQELEVEEGQTVFIPAGTLHALGPGMLLYEVQQSSDTTYRVYDWDRPASAGRRLHLEESVAVTDPEKGAQVYPAPRLEDTAAAPLVRCPYFTLDLLQVENNAWAGNTAMQAFEILTVIAGSVRLRRGNEQITLERHQTALIAAAAGAYHLEALSPAARVLRATVPHDER
ncbi:mannose-6-phosphate isomerase [Deinobacterium chartae]|uniref:Mannose-6-phosphate isomerase n=1 Tax=Deinobacterium chartae TaxID=521158 RepID=A0A841HWY8_9DEIO|nr:type I phosphomannose isomerase catalytic subunit [Deinobacterium chartae]MBB6097373.1 mannose-6-phosphate isomerase [Deinobacterium chartae]